MQQAPGRLAAQIAAGTDRSESSSLCLLGLPEEKPGLHNVIRKKLLALEEQ